MTIDARVREACVLARKAARAVAIRSTADKDRALRAIADAVEAQKDAILAANAADLEAASSGPSPLSPAMRDRLMLNAERVAAIAKSVREVAGLKDPVGDVVSRDTRPNGLNVTRVRVPLGVIAMIYEARPNVTVEASALTLKAGNAVVLRGGSEASRSNQALAAAVGDALESTGFPRAAVQVLPFTDRDAVRALVQQSELVDLAIPRGGEALIRFVTENARVPVVQHYKGVCHMFVDAGFDAAEAARIVANAKLSRPGVCNALECLLVHQRDAATTLPIIAAALGDCAIHADPKALALLEERPSIEPATDDDWGKEFLDRVLAVKVVADLDAAMAHVADYGSGHTEAILTPDPAHADRWRREVDAACVVVNASTRFHDGGELGLGAEIGIATSRLHWRGPMGLESLTTMKWVVDGDGQTR